MISVVNMLDFLLRGGLKGQGLIKPWVDWGDSKRIVKGRYYRGKRLYRHRSDEALIASSYGRDHYYYL